MKVAAAKQFSLPNQNGVLYIQTFNEVCKITKEKNRQKGGTLILEGKNVKYYLYDYNSVANRGPLAMFACPQCNHRDYKVHSKEIIISESISNVLGWIANSTNLSRSKTRISTCIKCGADISEMCKEIGDLHANVFSGATNSTRQKIIDMFG